MKTIKNRKGQVLFEPLLAITIMSITLTVLISSLTTLVTSRVKAKHRIQAAQYAQQSLEATYNLIANSDWGTFKTNVPGTFHPVINDISISLGPGKTAVDLNPRFDWQIYIAEAKRDGVGNLDDVFGAPDPNTLKITSTVEWEEKGTPQEVTLTTYAINIY